MFSTNAQKSRLGTDGEEGTGFGMPILKMYLNKYEGDIEVTTSTTGETGTCFKLLFNKAA